MVEHIIIINMFNIAVNAKNRKSLGLQKNGLEKYAY